MTKEEKLGIQQCLQTYITKYASQSAAANSLEGISSATISQVLNGNWQNISAAMWNKIANQCCFKDFSWKIAETSIYLKLTGFFEKARLTPNGIRAIGIKPSLGKTTAIKRYCDKNKSAYYVQCYKKMRSRDVLRELLKCMGKQAAGTYHDMLYSLVHYMERDTDAVILVDEIDKLPDDVLQMFIDLENRLGGKVGIVFLSTMWFKTKMERGVESGKQGFAELWSRMRKDVIDLTPTPHEYRRDVQLIAIANGVNDEATITRIANSSKDDFRVVYDKLNAYINTQRA